jgi:hypothetical protein
MSGRKNGLLPVSAGKEAQNQRAVDVSCDSLFVEGKAQVVNTALSGEGAEEAHCPSSAARGSVPPSSGPWYSPHTGTNVCKTLEDIELTCGGNRGRVAVAEFESNIMGLIELRDGQFRAAVYPSGFKLVGAKRPALAPIPTNGRGEILSFSDEAARRLREWFFTMWVPTHNLWSFTLTTHGILTPEQWDSAMVRFRMAVKRAEWAGVWRVELQRRKAPHAHVAFWLPESATFEQVRDLWLRSTGEKHDEKAFRHAVEGRRIDQNESGWAVYMALHDGKHKEAQLGWKGKQWGIWNRAAFTERTPENFDINAKEHALLLRILRNLDRAEKMRLQRAKDQRLLDAIDGDTSSFEIVVKRPKRRLLHRGNLLRCIKGDTVTAIIQAMKSGRITF